LWAGHWENEKNGKIARAFQGRPKEENIKYGK